MNSSVVSQLHDTHGDQNQVYRVITIMDGKVKIQRWDLKSHLILPAPLSFVLAAKEGALHWGMRDAMHDADDNHELLDRVGDFSASMELNLTNPDAKIILELIDWEMPIERDPGMIQQALNFLVIEGVGTRNESRLLKGKETWTANGRAVVTVKTAPSQIEFSACKSVLQFEYADGTIEKLNPGQSKILPVEKLFDLTIRHGAFFWKMQPMTRTLELLGTAQEEYGEDASAMGTVTWVAVVFLLISVANFFMKNYGSNNEVAAVVPVPAPVEMTAAPEDLKIPEKFIEERKALQAPVFGDDKLPPGGQKDGPIAPAPAFGNGLPPPVDGGAKGIVDPKKLEKLAKALPKTHKVHAPKKVDALPKANVMANPANIKGMVVPSKVITAATAIELQQNQAQKLLEKKANSLKAAFGSVLGALNDEQKPDALSVTDPNAADSKAVKRGGLVIAKNGAGSGSDDQTRLLGQVGSDAGRGIEGGTGGSPNGVVGGTGLSTRYKGTGTTTGTGIGGSSQGKLFVDLDATATGDSQITEGLSKTEVGRVIHEHSSEIRQCYEAALIKNPAIRGRMSVNFAIAASGKVQSAKVQDSTFDSSFMGSCLIRKMQGWMFPKPKNGVSVEVTYPFNFRTLGGS